MTEENLNTKLEEIIGVDIAPDKIESKEEIIIEDAPVVEKITDEVPVTKNESNELRDLDKKINKRVDARVDRLERQLEKKIVAEREAYVGAIATVNERLQQALDNNNIKEYAQATEALTKLNAKKEELDEDIKAIKEEVKEDAPLQEKRNVEPDESAKRWAQSNKPFIDKIDSDAELSAVARAISQKLLKNGYANKPQIELLAEVQRQLVKKMPEEFVGIVNKDELPNVSGGKMDIGNAGGKKTYTINDVPLLDRQILKNYVVAKIYKDEKEAVTKYFQRKQQESR